MCVATFGGDCEMWHTGSNCQFIYRLILQNSDDVCHLLDYVNSSYHCALYKIININLTHCIMANSMLSWFNRLLF